MNTMTLDLVIQKTWAYQGVLHARAAHWSLDGQINFYSLVFPREQAILIKESPFTSRRATLTYDEPQLIKRGAWLVVHGELRSRDERVTLRDFIRRAENGAAVTPADLEALLGKLGSENRSINELIVDEVIFLGMHQLKDAAERGERSDAG